MGIIKDIAAKAQGVCEAGGHRWRLKPVRSADMARAGLAHLQMVVPLAEGGEDDLAAIKALPEDEQEQALQVLTAKRAVKLDERKLAAFHEHAAAVVCAGVTGVATLAEPDAWEDCRITRNEAEQDPDGNVLYIANLPPGCAGELFDAVQKLSGVTQEAAEELDSFREEHGPADGSGPSSQEVLEAAT